MANTDKPKREEITLDRKTQRALAYLSGIPTSEEQSIVEVIPDVSGIQQDRFERLMGIWLELQEDEIRQIGQTLLEVLKGFDLTKRKFQERLESPQYLKLIRKCFRNWSGAESEQKRIMMRNLLVNAVNKTLSPDFALAMFIDWLDDYADEHFNVIGVLRASDPNGLTRKEIWWQLHDYQPGEDTAEADMYKMLIHDLSTGHVIRQQREKDFFGNFVRSTPNSSTAATPPIGGQASPTLTKAFDDAKRYVLTELGKQFVSYTMTTKEVPEE